MSINNPSVFAVNGQQGDINLTPTDLGLGNVPNVDATSRSNHTGTQLASTISDFSESVDDQVASLLVAGTNITLNYDDVANTLTINSAAGVGYTDEQAQDAVGNILIDSSSVNFTYDDDANTITAAVLPAGVDHNALQNYVANQHVDHSTVAINAGAGLTGGGDITTSRTISMPNVGTAGTFGTAAQIPVFTTDAQGRVSAVTNTSIQIAQSQVTNLVADLSGKANLVGGNTFTGNQNLGGTFVNITPAPLNMVNSAGGALRTQLNLVNTGGGGGAGSAIDFFTYDVAGGSEPGARIAAIDDNFSAYFSFVTKNPGASNNAIVERMRITNVGQVGINANPVSSALLQMDSTSRGFLQPRMTSAQRLAISSPVEGLQVYDTDLSAVARYSGTSWFYDFTQKNTAIQTSTSNVYADLTEFITPQLNEGDYIIEFEGTYQSTATTTGIGIRLAQETATISFVSINWRMSQGGNGVDKYYEYSQTSLADNVSSTSTLATNTNFPIVGLGIFSISAAGSIALQFRSENTNAVSIRPTSILNIRKV